MLKQQWPLYSMLEQHMHLLKYTDPMVQPSHLTGTPFTTLGNGMTMRSHSKIPRGQTLPPPPPPPTPSLPAKGQECRLDSLLPDSPQDAASEDDENSTSNKQDPIYPDDQASVNMTPKKVADIAEVADWICKVNISHLLLLLWI